MSNTIIHFWKPILTEFLASIGTLFLIWEVACLILPWLYAPSTCCKIIVGVFILLLSGLYAWYQILRKPKSLKLEINRRTNLYIQKENLMAVNGVKVIPVNEYFDTHNGDGIIKPSSLHGQLIAIFDGRIDELKRKIKEQLSQMEPLPSNRQRTMVPDLPQVRYPLGTCIRITDNDNIYMLVAVTRFDQNEHVDVATEEYPEIIRKMYNGIEHLQDGNPVYLPLIGSGISGYQLTNMQILNTLVQMAHNADRLAVTKGIHICIYDDKQMDSLNLNIIEYLYNRWKTLK